MSEKLQYKISSRATILLGRESIARIESAVTEIVKNTYDADATMCFLTFDLPNDRIYILDDGIGMTRQTIENNWMLIGTDNKKVSYCSAKGRIKAGEKGIGRFALDRLGSSCEMYTKTADAQDVLHWSTDWDMFEVQGRLLDDMYATIEALQTHILDCLPDNIAHKIKAFCAEQNREDAFQSGTCFVIKNLRDHWSPQELRDLEKSLETLLPPGNSGEFFIAIQNGIDEDFCIIDDHITEEYDYKIHARSNGTQVEVELYRNEFDYDQIPEEAWNEEGFSQSPYRYEDFKKPCFRYQFEICKLVNVSDEETKRIVESVGPFEFDYVFMKLSMSKSSREVLFARETSKNRRAWMRLHSGIKIYRDGFWVRPYGDPNGAYDWLGLDARRAQNPTGVSHESETWNVRNAQGYGFVQISRIHNPYIVDVSSREGLVYNDVFKHFCRIIVSIIACFEKDRAHIAHVLKSYVDKVNEAERVKQEGLAIAERLLGHSATNEPTDIDDDNKSAESNIDTTQTTTILAQALKYYQEEREELISELSLLRALATSGLVTASIVHDLKGLQANLGVRIDNLRTSMLRGDSKLVERRLDAIKNDDNFMKGWLSVVATQSRPDKRRRKKYDLCSIVSDTVASVKPILEKKNIDISLTYDQPFEKKIFPIDMTSIVFNLIINSIESFSHSSVSQRKIAIDLSSKDEFIFTYTDNGVGLSQQFEDPYDIFRFGTTSKYDINGEAEGTGMGMYIVNSTLREYNSKPVIVNYTNGFSLQFTLQK